MKLTSLYNSYNSVTWVYFLYLRIVKSINHLLEIKFSIKDILEYNHFGEELGIEIKFEDRTKDILMLSKSTENF
jgi:hypothetical protein